MFVIPTDGEGGGDERRSHVRASGRPRLRGAGPGRPRLRQPVGGVRFGGGRRRGSLSFPGGTRIKLSDDANVAVMATTTVRKRKHGISPWIPNQHGAWAM